MGCVAAATLAAAGVAHADDFFTYQIQGTVGEVSDASNLLGATTSSTPFTLIYELDENKGSFFGAGGGGGGEEDQSGGADQYVPPGFGPGVGDLSTSPLSAFLQINGRTLSFQGASDGTVYSTYAFGLGDPDPNLGPSQLNISAQDDGQDGVSVGFQSWDARTFEGGIYAQQSLSMPSNTVNGTADFSYAFFGPPGAGETITGGLTPTSLVTYDGLANLSAAPEPSTWLLMMAGVGGIGLMLRRAKRTMRFRLKDALSA